MRLFNKLLDYVFSRFKKPKTEPSIDYPKWLTISQACCELGMPRRTLQKRVNVGTIATNKIPPMRTQLKGRPVEHLIHPDEIARLKEDLAMLCVKQVARKLHVDPYTVRRRILRGDLPAKREIWGSPTAGKFRYLIHPDDVKAYQNKQKKR